MSGLRARIARPWPAASAGACRPEQYVVLPRDGVQRAQMGDQLASGAAARIEVELLQACAGQLVPVRKRAARMRPSLPWLSRTATSRCGRAMRSSGDSRTARRHQPARRGLPQRGHLPRPGRERALRAQVPAAETPLPTVMPSGRLRPVSVVTERSDLQGLAGRRECSSPCRAAHSAPAAVTCSSAESVWCLARIRSRSATNRLSQRAWPRRIAEDLDPATDHRRVHREVDAIQSLGSDRRRGEPAEKRRELAAGSPRPPCRLAIGAVDALA